MGVSDLVRSVGFPGELHKQASLLVGRGTGRRQGLFEREPSKGEAVKRQPGACPAYPVVLHAGGSNILSLLPGVGRGEPLAYLVYLGVLRAKAPAGVSLGASL